MLTVVQDKVVSNDDAACGGSSVLDEIARAPGGCLPMRRARRPTPVRMR